ncbi:spore germination protein [Paenibacillus gansuensis]|uniref:Spore germination protein n=1 Tax=Paenibacillus gansuensis TaxID=306542 RepID=A0ABW5P9V8_9BACL
MDAGTRKLSADLKTNEETLVRLLFKAPDLVVHYFFMSQTGTQAFIAYLRGTTDLNLLQNFVRDLQLRSDDTRQLRSVLAYHQTNRVFDWDSISTGLLEGQSALFIQGDQGAYLCNFSSWPKRALVEPESEVTLRGSRIGFIESGDTNIALIRKLIPDSRMRMDEMNVGERSQTKVTLAYIDDIADKDAVEEMKSRIKQIKVDSIINTGELVEYIEDNNYSIFPQFLITERPDLVASNLLQGRIAVILDRSSYVLMGPMSFLSFFSSVDDINIRWPIVSFLRLLRIIGLLISIFLPSIYIAMVSFHYEIIPIDLVQSIGSSLERVPIPPIVEAMFMELFLEMLREAGLRLPNKIGQSVGIVGGIVIGQAAVQAGLVSNIMVIVVALTAIASFLQPNQDMAAAVRMIRFPFMLAAYVMGLVGIVIGIMILVAHIISLTSLKMPYTTPVMPLRLRDWKVTLFRAPLPFIKNRVSAANPHNTRKKK